MKNKRARERPNRVFRLSIISLWLCSQMPSLPSISAGSYEDGPLHTTYSGRHCLSTSRFSRAPFTSFDRSDVQSTCGRFPGIPFARSLELSLPIRANKRKPPANPNLAAISRQRSSCLPRCSYPSAQASSCSLCLSQRKRSAALPATTARNHQPTPQCGCKGPAVPRATRST